MTGRTITGAADTALAAVHVPFVVFVELDFDSGTVRYCNATHNVDWNGFTWLGIGNIGSIDAIEESADISAQGMSFQLSGVNAANLSVALGQNYQGRAAKVWLAPLDPATSIPVADPVGPFQYKMDTMEGSLGETSTVVLRAQSRLADWDRARILRYTDADQQQLFPGDRFFEMVPKLQDLQILF